MTGRGIAPSPVTHTLRNGSLSRIVTTQVTRPGNQGTTGDCFRSSLGMLACPGKPETLLGGLGVKWSQVQILSARQLNTLVRGSFQNWIEGSSPGT